MTENIEVTELRAQIVELERIVAAQAETIAEAHRLEPARKAHNEMLVLRTKKAEGALVAAQVRDWPKIQAHIKDYVDDYEMIGEDDQGRDGCHTPTDGERALIYDAIHGLLGEPEFDALYHPQPPARAPVGTLIDEGTKAAQPAASAEPVGHFQNVNSMNGLPPQYEQVAAVAKSEDDVFPLYRAPVAAQPSGRTNRDYAIEHAEYLAKSAERFIEAVCSHSQAVMEHDEQDTLETAKAADDAAESTGDAMTTLRSRIYEFRRRRDRATQPADGQAQQETCKTCQGNGEIVTDWERYQHPRDGDKGDEAVAECSNCDGQGKVEPAQQDAESWDLSHPDKSHTMTVYSQGHFEHFKTLGWQLIKLQDADKVDARTMPPVMPPETGVGEWCAPGPAAEQRRHWILRFEDADLGDGIFSDELTAREAFARAEGRGWNCHLFAHEPRAAQPDPAMAGDEWLEDLGYAAMLFRSAAEGEAAQKALAALRVHASQRVQPASGEDARTTNLRSGSYGGVYVWIGNVSNCQCITQPEFEEAADKQFAIQHPANIAALAVLDAAALQERQP